MQNFLIYDAFLSMKVVIYIFSFSFFFLKKKKKKRKRKCCYNLSKRCRPDEMQQCGLNRLSFTRLGVSSIQRVNNADDNITQQNFPGLQIYKRFTSTPQLTDNFPT